MKRRIFLETLVAGSLGAALSGCSFPLFSQPAYASYSSGNKQKVLLIGIDGVRPDALYVARTPHLDHLVAQGCYSDVAQAGKFTVSAPGWSNILCGVWEDKHGVTDNALLYHHLQSYPSIFTRLEQLHPELYTASLVSWKTIHDHIIPVADKRRTYHDMRGDWNVMKEAISTLTHEDPDLLFVYFGDADLVGHNYGFHPTVKRYCKEIEDIDKQVGYILQALQVRPTYASEDWLIICTTDHGGRMAGHGDNIPEDRTIFYIVSGSSALRGRLAGVPQQVDVVPTILQHLRIVPDPAWGLEGKVCGLRKAN
ncbi:alkaline phosphatase family protein [Candidatus Woesearchaeota archaeon]|nr:alkaline phosphatase family protein [Candidatus Woesearchaeota archaeon]